ncbi:4-hydroxy-3-methylbut-2-enyl diphosphate reductase [Pseudomonas coronafaciens pv. garcae]|nr:4-hydroxy-3-methylbut-2-enyl diphosphate reductase [Pseudomonas coronafaciens pv. garcae]
MAYATKTIKTKQEVHMQNASRWVLAGVLGTSTTVTQAATLEERMAAFEARASAAEQRAAVAEQQTRALARELQQIKLANPRGFCAGVDRAIEIVNRALEVFGPPIYVRHEVVHNKFVVEDLRSRGAIFVEELDQVPDDVIVIFSAHGVSQAVRTEASGRGLKVFDATCPLVTKVHIEVARYSRDGRECILIGHAGHPEVEGTMGQYDAANGGAIYLVEDEADVASLQVRNPESLAFVTQTTLSMDDTSRVIDALRQRFPAIGGPRKDDICYATQNRQDAVKQLADECDVVLVVGSPNSSNSNRLRELAERMATPAYLIDGAEDMQQSWFEGVERIGITAGASAPEVLVRGVIQQLQAWGATGADELAGREENITFSMPKELRVKSLL